MWSEGNVPTLFNRIAMDIVMYASKWHLNPHKTWIQIMCILDCMCATLSRRVVKSQYDAKVTHYALRACDIAVRFAPKRSREAIAAHGLRGDLLSLILRFDSADEDYNAARTLVLEVERSGPNSQVARALLQDVDLKALVNRWTQLYTTKRFKELRREAKARAVQKHQTGEARAVSELAADWLSAFKQKKRVLDVLTLQRRYTLRRLNCEALDDDSTRSDKSDTRVA